ncbi:MAG: hypothetical protein JNM56_34630 [Planctomycetia bacterium]|nr:hypothetical protein [Planctomycetia bacterium]
MARRNDNESKQGLTVALVLFVLLSVVLGLMAYFGYAEQKTLEIKARNESERAKQLLIERDRARLLLAVNQSFIGSAANKREEKQVSEVIIGLRNSKDKYEDMTHAQAYEAELKRVTDKKAAKWDPVSERPDQTVLERIAELEKSAKNENMLAKQQQDQLRKAEQDFQNQIAAAIKAKEAAEAGLANTKADVDQRIKGIDENYKKTVEEFQKNIVAAEDFAKELNKLRKDKEEAEAKYQAALKDAETKIKKIEEKIPQIDLLAYDQPKGKITRLEGTSTAYINLGRLDLVRPGLSFSIFSVGAYKANAERKASVEVIDVIADHLSKVRITDIRSAARDPIITGDLLYNPAWSPGMREHVAVAGLIDLTGDGRDGTLDFIRTLEKQGVSVDAYLDTKSVEVKGRGMNRQTGYLIIGEVPEFTKQEQLREGDARQERKISISTEMGKLQDQARAMGVTIVPARRFMAMMGFKLPRTPATIDDWNAYTFRPQAAGGAAPAEGKEMMKKEEMKKDEK